MESSMVASCPRGVLKGAGTGMAGTTNVVDSTTTLGNFMFLLCVIFSGLHTILSPC